MLNMNKVFALQLLVPVLLVAFVSCSPQDNNPAYINDSYIENAYANEQVDEISTIVADNSTDDKYAPEPKNNNANEPSDPDEIQEEYELLQNNSVGNNADVNDNHMEEKILYDIEAERLRLRFPYISDLKEFIVLDNGTLVDNRLFAALELEGFFEERDLHFILDLIARHFRYMDYGDAEMLFSTIIGMDGSDSNHFHPAILSLMNNYKGSSLFVERIELSSVGNFRAVVSNAHDEELHIWPLIDSNELGYDSWRIVRYLNHIDKDWWLSDHNHLWEYVRPFHLSEKSS